MAFKETLAAAREQRGMTQQDLAEKLYVTRQAVSRWENGETEPSVDMRKLIATVLDVPVIQLFDIDVSQLCQCCGTPFTVPNMPHGTETDGTENTAYCKWCYDGGQFAYQSEDELIEKTAPFLMEATGMSQEEAVSFMGVLVPHLQHWQKWRAASAGNRRREFPDIRKTAETALRMLPERIGEASARLSPPGARPRCGCRGRSCAA